MTRWILLGVLVLSVAAAVAAGVWSQRISIALLAGIATLLVLISLYSLLAHLFGWPKLRWDDVSAFDYLWP